MAKEFFVFVLFLSISVAAGDMNCWTRPCVCCKSGQCADLDNKTCDGCIAGYTTPSCFDPCPENCVNCSQLFFNHNDNRTCYICKNSFYNGRYRDKIEQPLQNDCSLSCQTGCETCTSYFNCSQCKTGYFMNFEKECKKCIAHCANCTSPTNCLKCNDGYYNELEACMQCKPNCRTCLTESHCTSCEDGLFLAGNECIPCQSGCKNCFGINKCNSCLKGFYQSNDRCLECSGECANCYDNFTCKECRVNYFLYNGTCKRCGSDCLNCLSDIDCKYCADGYQVYDGKCYECPPLCATCSSNNVCAACKPKSFMLNGQCHSCPTYCISCSSYKNCTSCVDGYFGQNCSQTCPPDCHGKMCDKLTGICLSCETGFYFNDNKQCINCRKNCVSCTAENYCTLCENGYKGEYCQDECWNCKDGSTCNKTNGYCFDGCVDGFSGPKCNLKCDVKCFTCERYDRKSCIIHVCIDKNKNEIELVWGPCSNSEDVCETGFWGTRCEYSCTTGCRNNVCHRQNGSCIHGYAENVSMSCSVAKTANVILGVLFAASVIIIIWLSIIIYKKKDKRRRENTCGFCVRVPQDTDDKTETDFQEIATRTKNRHGENHEHSSAKKPLLPPKANGNKEDLKLKLNFNNGIRDQKGMESVVNFTEDKPDDYLTGDVQEMTSDLFVENAADKPEDDYADDDNYADDYYAEDSQEAVTEPSLSPKKVATKEEMKENFDVVIEDLKTIDHFVKNAADKPEDDYADDNYADDNNYADDSKEAVKEPLSSPKAVATNELEVKFGSVIQNLQDNKLFRKFAKDSQKNNPDGD